MKPLLETILSLVANGGSRALDLLARGRAALRGLFGNLRNFVRPLLKEGIAFLAEKLRRGAAVVREGGQKVGSTLLRFAEMFLGKRPAEPEHDAGAERQAEEQAAGAERQAEEQAAAPAPVVASAPAAKAPQNAPASAPIARAPSAAVIVPQPTRAPVMSSDALHTFGPVIGRALVTVLARPRPTRDMMRRATLAR